MANERVLHLPVVQTLIVVFDSTRKAIESGGADFSIGPDDDAADFGGRVFAPLGDVGGEVEKALVPFLAHGGLRRGRKGGGRRWEWMMRFYLIQPIYSGSLSDFYI